VDLKHQSETLEDIRDTLLGEVDFLYCQVWNDQIDYDDKDNDDEDDATEDN
jgi:hypothetical protein